MSKPDVRSVLLDELSYLKHAGGHVAVFMSAGVDSHSTLFALLELGIPVIGVSFTLDYHESRDFKYAQHTCETLGVPFLPVRLPTDLDHLKKFMNYAAQVGARSKTDFECFWPMAVAMRAVQNNHPEVKHIVTATSADSHFALSKKANMHYKDKVDLYRTLVFKKRNTGQKLLLRAEAARLGFTYQTPYDTTRMCSELYGYTWEELNKPKQKQPIRDAFPEYFDKIKVTNHTNLQLGDSGIADHFTVLLEDDEFNPDLKFKATKGVYNELLRRLGLDSEEEED